MQATSSDVYNQIDNALYNEQGNIWWDENQFLHLLKSSVNPARVGYFRRLLNEVLHFECHDVPALDVGCGGGILAEEFAAMGFHVAGIDPSEQSLATAQQHAQSRGLTIDYHQGTGEFIPYADNTFPVVYCCDVLEHVRDLPKVISEEIYRVPHGRLFLLRHAQPHLHQQTGRNQNLAGMEEHGLSCPPVSMSGKGAAAAAAIKPEELKGLLTKSGFESREFRGTSPDVSLPRMIALLRQRASGKIGYKELGQNFKLTESHDLNILYMGYAIKPA